MFAFTRTTPIFSCIATMLLAATMLLGSCAKPTNAGSDLLPASDDIDISYADSNTDPRLLLKATTVADDSVVTYLPSSGIAMGKFSCGYINDPIFGKTTSSIYSQLRLSFPNPDFTGATLDSLILILYLSSDSRFNIGDTLSNTIFNIHEMTSKPDINASYYTKSQFGYAPTPIGNYLSTDRYRQPRPRLGVPIRIRLSAAFGNKLLQNPNYFDDNATFQEAIKGLYITPAIGCQTMLRYLLTESNAPSRLTIYYKAKPTDTNSTAYDLLLNNGGVRTINAQHNIAGTPVQAALNSAAIGDSVVYVQGLGGSNIKVDLPNIRQFGKIIVNKAELWLTEIPSADTTIYKVPRQLTVTKNKINPSDITEAEFIREALYFSAVDVLPELEGTRRSRDAQGRVRYKLNMASYMQAVVDGKTPDQSIFVKIYNKTERVNRAVFGGPKNSKYKMEFKFWYTKL